MSLAAAELAASPGVAPGARSAPRIAAGIAFAMIAIGVALRVQNVAAPPSFTFDEQLFVSNAHNYLVGEADLNDHPPLGKLLLALGLSLFGYNSLGWRFVPLCFGIETVLVGAALARTLFGNASSARFAAALLAYDGFFIAYSRAGLLDGMLTCLVLAAVLAAARAESVRGVCGVALLVGLAASLKWSGALAAIPALGLVLARRRVPVWGLLAFGLVPLVHLGIWKFGLSITRQPSDLASLWGVMSGLYRHHLELGTHHNDLASPWYTWPWLFHPIVVKLSQHGTTSRYASSVGNPLAWVAASALVLGVPLFVAGRALWAKFRKRPRAVLSRLVGASLWLSLGWLALLSPWIIARGKYTFMYHYLPCYAFGLLAVAGWLAELERRFERAALAVCAVLCSLALYFTPVWAEFPTSQVAAERRLIFASWRP